MPLIFPSFSKGPWGFHASQNILLASLIRRLCPSLLAYSTRKGALHHWPLFFFGSSTIPILAVVRLICACTRPEKPSPVRGACYTWYFPSPLISPLWTPSPGVSRGSPRSPPGAVFQVLSHTSTDATHFSSFGICSKSFSLCLFHSRRIILDFLSSLSWPLKIRLIVLYFLYHRWLVLCDNRYSFASRLRRSLFRSSQIKKNLPLYESCSIYSIKGF
jgi:hypothetical protein